MITRFQRFDAALRKCVDAFDRFIERPRVLGVLVLITYMAILGVALGMSTGHL